MQVFKQGADVIVKAQIIDSPTVDFSTAVDIHVTLFVGTKEQAKYSLNPKAGYGTLTVDSSHDTLDIVVERESSINFDAGLLTANIIASYTNGAFEGGIQRKVWDNNAVARITAGRALDDIMP